MSLKLGELVAEIKTDNRPLELGLAEGRRVFKESGKEMERDARGSGMAMARSLAGAMPKAAFIAAGAVGGALMAAALVTALSAGVVLALGGGFLALGIKQAVKDPAVAKAWEQLGGQAQKTLAKFAEPFKAPMIRAAQTFSAALNQIAPGFERIGAMVAPIIDKLAPGLASLAVNAMPGLERAVAAAVPLFDGLARALPAVGDWLSKIFTWIATDGIPAFSNMAGFLQRNWDIVAPFVVTLATFGGILWTIITAMRVWTAVQAAFNVVMALNPIGLIIIGIALLVAAIVWIATKTTWFQTAWKAAWGGIKAAAGAVGSWFRDTLWGSWIKGTWDAIVRKGDQALGWFKSLPGKIRSALQSVGSYILAPYKWAFNQIARVWNGTVGRLSFTVPSWVPGLGGHGFSMPNIPQLAKGGVVRATAGGRVVNVAEGGRDEVVAPLTALTGMIRDAVRPQNADMPVPEVHVYIGDRELTDIVDVRITHRDRQLVRRTGPRTLAAAR